MRYQCERRCFDPCCQEWSPGLIFFTDTGEEVLFGGRLLVPTGKI